MQVNNIQSKTNFNGIYRIPNTPENVKLIKEKVVPMYEYIKREQVCAFPGNYPLVIGLEFIMEQLAKQNQASRQWLVMNARNFGTKIPNLNKDYLHVISSKRDIDELVHFITKRMESYNDSPLQKVINIFKGLINKDDTPPLPEHIKVLNKSIEIFENEAIEYRKFLSDKEVIEVTTPQQLLARMLSEK